MFVACLQEFIVNQLNLFR